MRSSSRDRRSCARRPRPAGRSRRSSSPAARRPSRSTRPCSTLADGRARTRRLDGGAAAGAGDRARPATAVLPADASLVVVADQLGDPGNAGTIIRSAEAAGADAVVLTPGSVDPFNPKVVRASAGSLFRVPVVTAPLDSMLAASPRHVVAPRRGLHRPSTSPRPSRSVIGNEAHGLPDDAAGRRLGDDPRGGREPQRGDGRNGPAVRGRPPAPSIDRAARRPAALRCPAVTSQRFRCPRLVRGGAPIR